MMRIIERWRVAIVLIGIAFFITACETTSTSSGPSYLDAYQITEVVVNFEGAREPMHVAEIETNFRRTSLEDGTLSRVGQRFSSDYRTARRQALLSGIEGHLKPHLQEQLTKKFKGTKPAKAIIHVKNTFIRARADLAALTGTQVIRDGVASPTENQLIASVWIAEVESNLPIDQIDEIRVVEDDAIVVFGGYGKAPEYGPSKRLNKMAFEWANKVVERIELNASGAGRYDTGNAFTGPGVF